MADTVLAGAVEVDGRRRLAVFDGDTALVGGDLPATWDEALQLDAPELLRRLSAPGAVEEVPDAAPAVPLGAHQEVWASGVTYERSREARTMESQVADVYDLVYEAERPELFFKAPAWRVVGDGELVGIRRDSTWDVPEPELALVVTSRAQIVGLTIGNDMSSRSIEGANPLYLPQAKTYERSCALGPRVLLGEDVTAGLGERTVELTIRRGGEVVVEGRTGLDRMTRTPEELVAALFHSLSFPHGVVLLTGTGIVPPDGFTQEEGDVVEIAIDGLGRLTNLVTRV